MMGNISSSAMLGGSGIGWNSGGGAWSDVPNSGHVNVIKQTMDDLRDAGLNPILGFDSASSAVSSAYSAEKSANAQIKASKIAGIVSIVSSALSLAGGVIGK